MCLYKPKWFRSDKDLIEGDLVYFVKKESKLSSKWTIGMVDSVEKGRDGILREVSIKYCNSNEQRLSLTGNSSKDRTMPRYTERAIRKIVKIFSIEDASLAEDMAEFEQKMKKMPDSFIDADELAGMVNIVAPKNCKLKKSKLDTCCCEMHCKLSFHQNLHHKFDEDSVLRPVQVGELDEFAWEEVNTYSLASDGLWDNINMDEVLDKQA